MLLLTRVVILLTQLQDEDFQTRAVIQPCTEASTSNTDYFVLISHSEDRDPNSAGLRKSDELKYQVEVTLGDVRDPPGLWETSCSFYLDDPADRLRLHICRGLDKRGPSYGIKYSIALTNTSSQPDDLDLPMLWFAPYSYIEHIERIAMIPYLASPLQPLLGMYALNGLHYAERRFITSSGIKDTITGSKPTYGKIITTYPWTQISSHPLLNNLTIDYKYPIIAYGAVLWPKSVASAHELTQATLQHIADQSLCQVVEDYRTGSPLDILGSIGGLLALLQGIHIFLFGRPLFWGLFGVKLLSPFGILGNVATGGFRKRLAERYGTSGIEGGMVSTSSAANQSTSHGQEGIDMTQFLLDYVLDMGPALNRSSRLDSPELELPCSRLDIGEFSENQDTHNKYNNDATEPLLTVDQSNFGPMFFTTPRASQRNSWEDSEDLLGIC